MKNGQKGPYLNIHLPYGLENFFCLCWFLMGIFPAKVWSFVSPLVSDQSTRNNKPATSLLMKNKAKCICFYHFEYGIKLNGLTEWRKSSAPYSYIFCQGSQWMMRGSSCRIVYLFIWGGTQKICRCLLCCVGLRKKIRLIECKARNVGRLGCLSFSLEAVILWIFQGL